MRAGENLIEYRSGHNMAEPVHFHKDCAPDGALDLPEPPSMADEVTRDYKGPVVAFDGVTGMMALTTIFLSYLVVGYTAFLSPSWAGALIVTAGLGIATVWIAYMDANANRETLR